MRKHRFLLPLFVLALFAAASLPAQNQAKPPQLKATTYGALVAAAKAGDKDVDYKQMRLLYMGSAERQKARDTRKESKAMTADINAGNCESALKNATMVIDNEFVDIEAHFVAYVAHKHLNHEQEMAAQKMIVDGLLHSITDSGDGKSLKTAWTVITVHEEYVLMSFLGLHPSGQSQQDSDGHAYDVMTCIRDDSGEKVTLYFNVDIPFESYKL